MQKAKLQFKIQNFYFFLVVFTFSFFIFILAPHSVRAAKLYFFPQYQIVFEGDSFIADIYLNTEGESINAVEVHLNFDRDILEVYDFNTGGSLLALFLEQPQYSNQEGTLSFIGGVPRGFSGNAKVGEIIFKTRGTGKVSVSFAEDSQVLLHDGKGTPTPTTFGEGAYSVVAQLADAPVLFSRSHSDQTQWHRQDVIYIQWDIKEGAQYSYVFTRDQLEIPDEVVDEPVGDIKLEVIEQEGIFYFALREKKEGEDVFGPTLRYRVMIDRSDPEPFEPELVEIEGSTYLTLSTTDKISGIEYYEVKGEDEEEWTKIDSVPYPIGSLRGTLLARAVDGAGNTYTATVQLPFRFIFGDFVWLFIIIVFGGISTLVYLWFKRRTTTTARFTLR